MASSRPPLPRLPMPRAATDLEVEQLVSGTVVVALTGRRARPLMELIIVSGERILPVYRTRAGLMEAAIEQPLTDEGGVARGVAVDAIHALMHVGVARLDGLVIDAGLLGSGFVSPALAREVAVRAAKRESRPPSVPSLEAPPPSSPDESPPRVVVIDDDPLVLRTIERLLTKSGATVSAVASPLEAAAVVYLHRPTVLVLDVMMPGMSGEHVWSLLRSASPTPPRVIFYSGIGARELAAVAAGDPYVDRVSKEDGPDALLEAVVRAHRRGPAR